MGLLAESNNHGRFLPWERERREASGKKRERAGEKEASRTGHLSSFGWLFLIFNRKSNFTPKLSQIPHWPKLNSRNFNLAPKIYILIPIFPEWPQILKILPFCPLKNTGFYIFPSLKKFRPRNLECSKNASLLKISPLHINTSCPLHPIGSHNASGYIMHRVYPQQIT